MSKSRKTDPKCCGVDISPEAYEKASNADWASTPEDLEMVAKLVQSAMNSQRKFGSMRTLLAISEIIPTSTRKAWAELEAVRL